MLLPRPRLPVFLRKMLYHWEMEKPVFQDRPVEEMELEEANYRRPLSRKVAQPQSSTSSNSPKTSSDPKVSRQ